MPGILDDDFCIYCQQQFTSAKNLQKHVLAEHKHTYAFYSIMEARKREHEKASQGHRRPPGG